MGIFLSRVVSCYVYTGKVPCRLPVNLCTNFFDFLERTSYKNAVATLYNLNPGSILACRPRLASNTLNLRKRTVFEGLRH
jgi:hypothetical protein